MSSMAERRAKLPVWAQEGIAALEREVAALKVQLDAARNEHPGSNTAVCARHSINARQTLEPGALIEFTLDSKRYGRGFWVQAGIASERNMIARRGALLVQGAGPLIVIPHSANTVSIAEETL